MDLRPERLRALIAVARAGGFSRAARALGRTQSSISQAVAALEDDVGELLVVRDGRRTHLTDAGAVLVDHGERVLAALDDARGALASVREVATGRLALGTSDTFALYLLPPALAAFRARHPAIELRLDNRPSPIVAARVADRTLDVGVVALPLPSTDRVSVRAIAPLRDVAIVPPDHPLARRRRLELAELAEHPLVLLDRSTAARAHLDAAFAARRLTPRIAMEMSSVEVIKRLVTLGFGVSVIPELAARDVTAIPVTGLGPPREVGIVVPSPGPTTRAARAFVEILVTACSPSRSRPA